MRLLNFPKRIAREAYEAELSRYLGRIENVDGLLGVMTMGSVKAPGLSDLDVICIVDDEIDAKDALQLSTTGFDPNLFLHGPVIVPQSLVANLQLIIYASNLIPVAGQDFRPKIRIPDTQTDRLISLAYVIDFSESRLAQFNTARRAGTLDVRGWMTRLWSLVHTQRLCEMAGVQLCSECAETIRRVKLLRHSWLDGEEVNAERFHDAFDRSEKAVKRIFTLGVKRSSDYVGKPSGGRKVFQSGDKRIICLPGIQEPTSRYVHIRRIGRFTTTFAPVEYAKYLSQYFCDTESEICNTESAHCDRQFAHLLKQRSELVQELERFHFRKQCRFSLGGYTGLPQTTYSHRRRILTAAIWKLLWSRPMTEVSH